tara:strand:+ start:128948 stop:129754 length:807 start_codon:yes stop_codon:yes gene_type:complete
MLRKHFIAVLVVATTPLMSPGFVSAQNDGHPIPRNSRVLQVAPLENQRAAANEARTNRSADEFRFIDPQVVDHQANGNHGTSSATDGASRAASAETGLRSIPSLADRRQTADDDSRAIESPKSKLAGPAVTVTSSLAVVLGLFALMIWLTRRFGSRTLGQTSLPNEVLQSLGTATLDARTKVNLLRCGGRVIVVAQTPTGVYPISEFTSPEEVRQLIASCQSTSKQSFAQTLQAFEKEAAPRGFVGHETPPPQDGADRRKRGRLFATA